MDAPGHATPDAQPPAPQNARNLEEDEFISMMRETNTAAAHYVKTLSEVNENLKTLISKLKHEQSGTNNNTSTSTKKPDQIKALATTCTRLLKNIGELPLDHCKKLTVQLTFMSYQNEDWRKKVHLSMLKYLGDTNKSAFTKAPAHVVPLHFARWREDSSNNYRNQQHPSQSSPPLVDALPPHLTDIMYPGNDIDELEDALKNALDASESEDRSESRDDDE